jgi:hypothetical protein
MGRIRQGRVRRGPVVRGLVGPGWVWPRRVGWGQVGQRWVGQRWVRRDWVGQGWVGRVGSGGDRVGRELVGWGRPDGLVRDMSVRDESVAKKVAVDPPSFNWLFIVMKLHLGQNVDRDERDTSYHFFQQLMNSIFTIQGDNVKRYYY